MRWTFQLELHKRMREDARLVLLWGDVGGGLFKAHAKDFPTRVVNVGICEQATVSMAAGMAMQGLRPIVYTITPFLIERAFEQIKLDVSQQNLPVGLVGYSDGLNGPTHREVDAPALMGLLPNIRGFYPKDKAVIPQIMQNLDVDSPWFLCLHE
jgi:transketolase